MSPFYTQEEETSQEVADPPESVSQAEGASGSQDEAGPSGTQQDPRPSTSSQSPPRQMRPPGQRSNPRLVQDASLQMIREASALMRAPLNPTEAYSASVAHDLNEAGVEQRRLAKDLINQVLWWMRRDLLTLDTGLCDPARLAEHHHPAATSSPSPPASGRGRGQGRSAVRQPGGKAGRKRRR